MAIKILVMGLSSSGKTSLAEALVNILDKQKSVFWINADAVRQLSKDWDFSEEGRTRQAHRLYHLAEGSDSDIVICDFIAPLPESRKIFNADYTIWMDTIKRSKYRDTDQAFIDPHEYNYMISDFDNINLPQIVNNILGLKHNFDVLYNIQIPEVANSHTLYSGMDTLEECVDKHYFINYNKIISYNYNSRGFRDVEWKDKNLSECIWCFGDSFTVGLGQPQNECWPKVLESKINKKTINISLNGGSVNWITRQVIYVLNEIQPKNIIIQWTFLSRREIEDKSLSDMSRRISHVDDISSYSLADDVNNFVNCLHQINDANKNTNIIHSWVPNFCQCDTDIFIEIIKSQFNISVITIPRFEQLDYARDFYHYDIQTSQKYVSEYIKLLKF